MVLFAPATIVAALIMNANSLKRLLTVHPLLARKVTALVSNLAAQGFDVEITQAMRTVAEQDALYSQGRTRKGPKVTNARGGQSLHNFGCAVDLALLVNGKLGWPEPHPVWAAIGREAARLGLEHGGAWRKPDLPHVQLKNVPPVSLCYALYIKGGLALVWAEVERIQPR